MTQPSKEQIKEMREVIKWIPAIIDCHIAEEFNLPDNECTGKELSAWVDVYKKYLSEELID